MGTATAARAHSRERVLAAARPCFLAEGVRATPMEDVARAAGVGRQLVYELFLGRREVVEAAVSARTREIADEIAADLGADLAGARTERGGRFWWPLLDKAKAEGLLRTDISTAELADWLRTVYTSMILCPDLDPAEERELIQRFVLTSLAMVTRV